MSTIVVVLKCIVSLMAVAGTMAILSGLGIVPVDDDFWNTAVAVLGTTISDFIGPQLFCLAIGCTKILSVLKLWGYGPLPSKWLLPGLMVPPLCATYGHFILGDTDKAMVAGVFVILVSAHYVIHKKTTTTAAKAD